MKNIRSLLFVYFCICAFDIASGQIQWQFNGTVDGISVGRNPHSLTGCNVNGDSYDDLIAGSTGYVYVFHGSATGFPSTPSATLSGTGAFGRAVTCGRLNNDNYDDVVVGDSDNFLVKVFMGTSAGLNTTAALQILGSINTNFGISLTSGDMNGDSYDDVAIGAPNTASGQGAVYIYYASSSGSGLQISLNTTIAASESGAQFGNILACGPIDGDAYSDLLVGSPSYNGTAGRVQVFQGSASGLQSTVFWTKNGNFSGNKVGSSISVKGDVNKDGVSDIAIASYQLVEIYFGNSTLSSEPDSSYSFPTTDTVSCAIVPDTNKDSFDDILIGEPQYGRVRLMRGGNLPLSNTTVYTYTSSGTQAGTTVYGLGDIDGDTGGDIVLSEPLYNSNTGRITVVRQLAPSASPTPSVTPSITPTPSVTPSISPSHSPSASVTPTATATPTVSPSGSASPSPSRSPTPSRSPSRTPSVTPSASASPGVCNPPTIISCGTFCTSNPADCTPSSCPDDTPFLCNDDSCVDSASGCNETECGSLLLCWDGNCASTVEDCAPVPPCPDTYPLRCSNGCFPANSSCEPLPCTTGEVACVDGSCESSLDQCPNYNGCPLGSIECPSGECVTDSLMCACQESGATGAYQCYEDGCSDSCKRPPWKVKPAAYTVTVIATSTTTFTLSDTDGNSIGGLVIPANSFASNVMIEVDSVPDSVILGSQGAVTYVAPSVSLKVQSGQMFSTPISLCLQFTLPSGTTEKDLSDACLMTLNAGNWECNSEATVNGTSLCGSLTHFSEWSFGILDQPSDSSSDSLPLWALIVIIVGGAAVLGAIVTIIVVVVMKRRRRAEEYEMW